MAHLLTDEAFALTIGHFRRVGRTDERGYWIAAIASTFIPWNLATLGGVLLGAQIPDPARFGIDIIFPAAMVGLAVGLVTGRRELVAAIVGAGVGVVVALLTGPSIGIVAGGIVGPAVGLLVPATLARETAPLGTPASADRYAMPGTAVGRRVDSGPDPVDGPPPPPPPPAGPGRAMSTDLVLLAVLMFAVTYPTRALGLLTPGLERLPKIALDYLQLVGPAVLTAIAAVNVIVVTDDVARHRSTSASSGWPCCCAWPSRRGARTCCSGSSRPWPSWRSPGRPAWQRSRPERGRGLCP